MSESHPILHGCILDGTGGAQEADEAQIIQALKDDRPAWVHLDATHGSTRAWMEKHLPYLDPLILEALLAEETRPRLQEINDGSLMILRGVNLNEGAEPEDMISIRIWVDEHRLITLRRRKLKAVVDIREKLLNGQGPQTIGALIAQLSLRLFERMEPIMIALDDRTDDIEERILDHADPKARSEIIALRKQAMILLRYIAPQKEAINQLRQSDQSWLTIQDKRRFQEAFDRVTRYVEDLDAIRERAQIVKDELANALSDRLNKNLYILSVISAVFLPLGFLTGLMGINIGGMPGVDNPNAFWLFTGALIALTSVQIILFKLLRWF